MTKQCSKCGEVKGVEQVYKAGVFWYNVGVLFNEFAPTAYEALGRERQIEAVTDISVSRLPQSVKVIEEPIKMTQYQAYSADTKLSTAIKQYKKKTGQDARLVVVPDWYTVSTAPPAVEVLLSPNCSAIMITSEDETEFQTLSVSTYGPHAERVSGLNMNNKDKPEAKRSYFHATCPHCKNTIRDWSQLGHYWEDKQPPYWDALVAYIFKRDKYTCAMCDDTLDGEYLDAHHIVPRNKGGEDGSENLITLCNDCHDWLHEYYEGIEERTGKEIRHFEPIIRPK